MCTLISALHTYIHSSLNKLLIGFQKKNVRKLKKGWTFEVFTSIFMAVMLKLRNFLQVQPSVKKKITPHTSSGDQEFFCYDFFSVNSHDDA